MKLILKNNNLALDLKESDFPIHIETDKRKYQINQKGKLLYMTCDKKDLTKRL